MRKFIRETLLENKLYPTSIEASITKKLGDNSDELKSLIAIFGLFRQQRPFNQVGDINKIQSRDELQKLYDDWLEMTVKELVKTREFLDNKSLAIKYVTAYKDNVRKLGGQAKPFSVKNTEKELIDLVNNNGWIKDRVALAGATSIYSPADSDVIYKDEDIWIVRGDTKAKCVNYGTGKSWCITKPDLNYYTTYRIQYGATIFFCMQPRVEGPEHTFVLMNYGDGQYAIADETNQGDRHGGPDLARSWGEIEQEIPNLRSKEKYFKYVPVSGEEKEYSKIVLNKYDGDDLGDYVIEKTKNLVVNGGIITPVDFVRDYVAHGNKISDLQFYSLTDEIKDSLIEAGMELSDQKFDSLNTSQKRRYVNILINNNKKVSWYKLMAMPKDMKDKFFINISDEDFEGMMYYSSRKEGIISYLMDDEILMTNISIDKIITMLKYIKDRDVLVNYILDRDELLGKLNEYYVDYLFSLSRDEGGLLKKLLSKKAFLENKRALSNISQIIRRGDDKDYIIDLLINNDSFVKNINDSQILDLLKRSSNPKKIVNKIGDRAKNFISNISPNDFYSLIGYSDSHDEIVDIFGDSLADNLRKLNKEQITKLEVIGSNKEKNKALINKYYKLSEAIFRNSIRNIISSELYQNL